MEHKASNPVDSAAWGPVEISAVALSLIIVVFHLVYAAHAGPLWRDEAADINFATMASWTDIWNHLHLDNFPPLLLAVLRIWDAAGLGATDAGYRVLGCLVGLSLLAILWVVSRLFRLRAPLLGLVLFGLTPYTYWFGDAIRPYGIGIGFTLLTFGLVWRLTRTGSPIIFILAAATAVLSVQALYQSTVLILAVGIAGTTVCLRRRQTRRALLVLGMGAVAAVSLLPYLPLIQKANEWSFISRSGLSWGRLMAMLAQALSAAGVFSVVVWAVLTGAALVIATTRVLSRRGNDPRPEDSDLALYAALTIFLSVCLFLGLLKYIGLPTQPWYFLAPVALTAVALDAVFFVFIGNNRLAARWTVVAIAATTALLSLPSVWEKANIRQTNLDLIAARIELLAGENDLIVVDPWMYGITFQRYFHKQVEWQTVPPMTDHRIHRYDLLKSQMGTADPLRPLMGRIAETLKSGHRVWVVGTIVAPPENRQPIVLPPAPHSPVGWSEGDYQLSWSMQIGHFLVTHAMRGQLVDIPVSQAVNPFENATLAQFDGWHAD